MKQIIYILAFVLFTSCGQSVSDKKKEQKAPEKTQIVEKDSKEEITKPIKRQKSTEKADIEQQVLSYEFKNATAFNLIDTISADFNGDDRADQAIYVRENGTSGIIIKHGQTEEEIKIGFGKKFAHMTDFNWVDIWGLVNDAKTYEIVIEEGEIIGDRQIALVNPSIALRQEEAGGGIITFRNGESMNGCTKRTEN